eukprot:1842152-Heterocapsa_arctica.AAC.1
MDSVNLFWPMVISMSMPSCAISGGGTMKSRRIGFASELASRANGSPRRNALLMSQDSAGWRSCAAVCQMMCCATLSAVGDSVSLLSLSLS